MMMKIHLKKMNMTKRRMILLLSFILHVLKLKLVMIWVQSGTSQIPAPSDSSIAAIKDPKRKNAARDVYKVIMGPPKTDDPTNVRLAQ